MDLIHLSTLIVKTSITFFPEILSKVSKMGVHAYLTYNLENVTFSKLKEETHLLTFFC